MRRFALELVVFEPYNLLDQYENGLLPTCLVRLKMLGKQLQIRATDVSHITRIAGVVPFPVDIIRTNTRR